MTLVTFLIYVIIGRSPLAILFFLILLLLVALPWMILGKKDKSYYPNNEKISKNVRDFLVFFHILSSIIFAIIITKYLQHNVPLFTKLFEENGILIPVTCVILIIVNSIFIGILIEQVTRRVK